MIDSYVARGVRAGFDVIPNSTGGTMIAPDLVTLFRPWYKFTGGVNLFLHNLTKLDYRKQIRDAIYGGTYCILNPKVQPEWEEEIRILRCSEKKFEGKTAKQVSAMMGKKPWRPCSICCFWTATPRSSVPFMMPMRKASRSL